MKTRIKFAVSISLSMTLLAQTFAMPVFAQTTDSNEVQNINPIPQGSNQLTTPSALATGLGYLDLMQTTPSLIDIVIENSTGNINLTEQGTIDWIHLANATSYKQVPEHTIAYNKLGETQITQMTDSPVSFTWVDGTPEIAQTDIKTGKVHKQQIGGLPVDGENGWQFNVGADSRKRNLTFTCGGWQSQFVLAVYVDGAKQAAYEEEFATTTTAISKKMSFYLAPNHTYEVKAVMKKTTHSNGNVTLSSIFVNEAFSDKTQLKSFVSSLNALGKENYTVESWIGMSEAIKKSQEVLTDIAATQEIVDASYTALMNAVIGLVYADGVNMQDKLSTLVIALGQVSINGYTQKTKDKLLISIIEAKEALTTNNINKQWDLAYAKINTALNNLKSEAKYMDQTNPGLTSSFGWEGDKHAPIAYVDGSYLLRDRAGTMVRFGITGIPGKIKWENHAGYLPCFDHEYSKDGMAYKIENFGDKVEINGNDYLVCYSRVTITNNSGQAQLLPIVSPELVPLNDQAKDTVIIQQGQTLVRDYAIAGDRFGKTDIAWPTEEEIIAKGSWDDHFTTMQTYWDNRLEKIATLEKLPDQKLINAYKAGYIYTLICKDGNALHVGENGYDRMYDHDTMGIIASLLTIGDFTGIKDYLDILPSDTQFEDSKWKFSWPFALYLSKTGDKDYIRQNFERIKSNTRKITQDRVNEGKGIIKVTYSVDNWGQWTIDNWSALFGLVTYKYLCTEIGEMEEANWASQQYDELLDVTNKTLESTLQKYNIDYIPCSIVQPNEISARCADPRDANWASMFLFGRWGWDGYLFNARQEGANLDLIDNTYTYGFDRAKQYNLGDYNFGGYPHGIYSSAYNAGYGSTALRGEEYRDAGIKAYQFMINNSMSGPFGWWEGVDYQDATSPWETNHAKGGGGSCQHMWGQSVATKVLIDSIIAEKVDGEVIIGRGIPNEWIVNQEDIKIDKYPLINNKRMGYDLSVSGKTITLNFNGDAPAGPISIELPILKNNIESASVGTIDNKNGKVTVNASTRTVIITIKNIIPEKFVLLQPTINAVEKQDGQIKVTWDKVENAEGYVLECLLNESVVTIATVKEDEALIDIKKLYPGFKYDFRVKAYAGSIVSKKSEAKSYILEHSNAAQGGQLTANEQELVKGSIINLSQEGTKDWMRLGKQSGLTIDRKNIATVALDIKLIGNKKITQMKDSIVKFNWNDGSNEVIGEQTTYGAVFNPMAGDIKAKGDLWMITALADTKERVLRIYTSTWAANTSFKAYLSDNSAPATTHIVESKSGSMYKVFEFRYKANADNETLCVTSAIDEKFNGNGNTTLLAATLSEVEENVGIEDGSYTVKYLDEADKIIAPQKVVTNLKQGDYTEQAINISGYKVKGESSKHISISKDVKNVEVIFRYEKNASSNTTDTGSSSKGGSSNTTNQEKIENNKQDNNEDTKQNKLAIINLKEGKNEIVNFKDLSENFATNSIKKLAQYGIMKGDSAGKFNPKRAISRGEVAVILRRIVTTEVEARNTFSDIKDNKFYDKAVVELAALGIMKGDQDASFKPQAAITRGEFAVSIGRLLAKVQDKEKLPNAKPLTFKDSQDIKVWAIEEISILEQLGIIKGDETNSFNVDKEITREEVSVIIERLLVYLQVIE